MRRGFSLVEIAIVLVILGLLTGGILVGQSLIRASEIRSLSTAYSEFATAVNTFRDKYMATPGELLTYKSFWPQLVGNYCPKTTWNPGNINGLIDNSYEWEAAFAQLQAAGLIQMGRPQILQDGTVRSFYDCMENWMQQTAGYPTKISNLYGSIVSANGLGNGLSFGTNAVPALTVEEGFLFDTKYDDGKPYTGKVRGGCVGSPGYCTSTCISTDTTSTYYMTDATKKVCAVAYYVVN